jgi:hypothetical protein
MNNKENGVGSETVIQVPMAAKIVPEKVAGKQASSTSRVLWIGAYVVLMVLIGLRLPLVRQHLAAGVPEDVKSGLGDDRLLSLSMTVGTVLFFLVYAVIMCLYFSLAGFLDRRLVPGKAVIGGRYKVGVFFVIPVLATVPVNLFSLALGIVQPRDIPGYWLYFPSIAVVALALFYRHWKGFPPGRKCLIVLSATGLSTILALG